VGCLDHSRCVDCSPILLQTLCLQLYTVVTEMTFIEKKSIFTFSVSDFSKLSSPPLPFGDDESNTIGVRCEPLVSPISLINCLFFHYQYLSPVLYVNALKVQ